MKKLRKYMPQDSVTKFCRVSSKINRLDEVRDKLRTRLLTLYEKGYRCPMHGPSFIDFVEQADVHVPWRKEFYRLAKQMFGSTQAKRRVKRVLERHQNDSGVKVALVPKVNPDF
jgi:hypothetical protein